MNIETSHLAQFDFNIEDNGLSSLRVRAIDPHFHKSSLWIDLPHICGQVLGMRNHERIGGALTGNREKAISHRCRPRCWLAYCRDQSARPELLLFGLRSSDLDDERLGADGLGFSIVTT